MESLPCLINELCAYDDGKLPTMLEMCRMTVVWLDTRSHTEGSQRIVPESTMRDVLFTAATQPI